MNHPHPLGILASSQDAIEAVDPRFLVEGLLRARSKTFIALNEIRGFLKEGMTEEDARILAIDVFRDMGVSKHWHRPYIRFGSGTTLTFHDPIQSDGCLQQHDPYYLDLGPIWPDSELGLE